jgi:hypothetical protein
MFISNDEKENMRISIRTLQAEMAALIKEVNALRAVKQKQGPKVIFRTEEAPWGYKLDGTPRKRSGRLSSTKPEAKNEQPVSV